MIEIWARIIGILCFKKISRQWNNFSRPWKKVSRLWKDFSRLWKDFSRLWNVLNDMIYKVYASNPVPLIDAEL